MLDRLTADTFAPAVGDTFELETNENGRLRVMLVEARQHDPKAPARDASGTRAPFSLVFQGPPDPLLPQRIYRLEHESLGPLEIFIVPIAQDPEGTSYEAVFA